MCRLSHRPVGEDRARKGRTCSHQKYRKSRYASHLYWPLLSNGSTRWTRPLPGGPHLPSRSVNAPLFPADLADDLPDCPQDFIRQPRICLGDRPRGGDAANERGHHRQGTLMFLGRDGDGGGAEPALDYRDDLLEALLKALADELVLSCDFTGGGRHGATGGQVVAMLNRQVTVKKIGQGRGTAVSVCRYFLEPFSSGGRKGFRCKRLLGRKLGVERPMRQSRLLTDLRDADTVNTTLPDQNAGRLNQRRPILGGLFLTDFQWNISFWEDSA